MPRLRFGRSTNRRVLPRPESWRLLILIFGLCVLVLAMRTARDPKNWEWLWGDPRRPNHAQAMPAQPEPLPLDTFYFPASSSLQSDPEQTYFPGVIAEQLSSIRDHTMFRRAEQDAWINLVRVLRGHDDKELERASRGRIGYVQLADQPEFYRGQLVTVQGIARRCLAVKRPREAEAPEFYQIILRDPDGPTSPLVIYCLEPPPGFPIGGLIAERVQATGFFFKNWAYSTGSEIYSAPLIVTKSLRWTPKPESTRTPPSGQSSAWIVVFAIAIGLALACLLSWRAGRTRPRPTLPGRMPETDNEQEVLESLRRFSEGENAGGE